MEDEEGAEGGGDGGEPQGRGLASSSESDDSGSFESLNSPRDYADASENRLEGGFSNGNRLREKVVDLVEKCERLERQKQAAVDILADKKRQLEDMKERYESKLKLAEADIQQLSSERQRLLDRLNLPESERASIAGFEKELIEMKKKMAEVESKCADVMEENSDLRHELRESRLEMEELHDQFREDEAMEFRELQKELESTAKNCRILQFKLRKMDKKCEQLELDKRISEERHRQPRRPDSPDIFRNDENSSEFASATSDDQGSDSQLIMMRRRIFELEEELRVAKEVSVKLHDQMEIVEEKRLSYEQELDRVTSLLNESEAEKMTIKSELMKLMEENRKSPGRKLQTLPVPQHENDTSTSKTPSPSLDLQLIMRDLNDSLEREHDLREQLKFSEEEIIVMRKKMAEMEEELESVNHQLNKLAAAKQATASKDTVTPTAKQEQELKLQIELAESEAKVLRRRLDEMDSSYEVLLNEVKVMRSRITSFVGFDSSTDTVGSGLSLSRSCSSWENSYEETVRNLAKDIDKLKIKLIERDQHADRSRKTRTEGSGPGASGPLIVKSRSLEDDSCDIRNVTSINVGGRVGRLKRMARLREEEEETRVYLDVRIQAEVLEQEALLLRSKVKTLEQEVLLLTAHNESLKKENRSVEVAPCSEDLIQKFQTENSSLKNSLKMMEDKINKLNKELLRLKFKTLEDVKDGATDGENLKEIKNQVQLLEDESRKTQKKNVDMESECLQLRARLEKWESSSPEMSKRREELGKNSNDFLKERVVELEGELKGVRLIVSHREEENERLENEISESREDLARIIDAFKRRETALTEELDDFKRKNVVVSDLLKLVSERAESTQREIDSLRPSESALKSSGVQSSKSTVEKQDDKSDLKALRNQIQILEKMLNDEKKKSETAALRLKMTDEPAGGARSETKLKQHEKDITKQELALCQKQLKAANEQIANLKERLAILKESNDDLKEEFSKTTKELEKTKKEKKGEAQTVTAHPQASISPSTGMTVATTDTSAATDSAASTTSTTTASTSPNFSVAPSAPPRTKEPASWRWEKQEMERQMKDLRKKLDDSYSEMKRYQVKWKSAGEDMERESQIKTELEKKIKKLQEENVELKSKIEELAESSKKIERQCEREMNMIIKERTQADKDIKQLSDMVTSKEDIIQQKDKLIAEKERSIVEKEKALRESTESTIVAEVSLRNAEDELSTAKDQLKAVNHELNTLKPQLTEKDQQLKQLDGQIRRRDDRLKEKDDFLQQINRKLVEKGNQVSDMDKTIRQIIRKLQARDCDLGMTNAELRRVQNELRSTQEKLQEAKARLDAWETKFKSDSSITPEIPMNAKISELESKLKAALDEKFKAAKNLSGLETSFKETRDKSLSTISDLETKLKLAEEKTHAVELLLTAANQQLQLQEAGRETSGAVFTPSDAYKQMMREKETLISERYKLNNELDSAKKEIESMNKQLEAARAGSTASLVNTEKLAKPNFLSLTFGQSTAANTAAGTPQNYSPRSPAATASPSNISATSTLATGSRNINGFSGENTQLIASLRAKLSQQELHWRAEKATLEEYYDAQAQQLRDSAKQLQASNQLLRKECDSQLLLLQNSRKALADLRHRFDLATVAWNEERESLRLKVVQVEDLKHQTKTLDKSLAEKISTLSLTETKLSDLENKMMLETAIWKGEREALEEKIKTASMSIQNIPADSAVSATATAPVVTKSTAFTRVSEFKARFEKFGRAVKKSEDQPEKLNKKSSLESSSSSLGSSSSLLESLVKKLQTQISGQEAKRVAEEDRWKKRLNDLNNNYEEDLAERKRKINSLERRDKEFSRMQKILSDLQFRFVDDANQWQLEKSQLQQQLDVSRKDLLHHKEAVIRLVAEVKKLKVLSSTFSALLSNSQSSSDLKTRSRSITPSAEKLRISALNEKEKSTLKTTLAPSESEGQPCTPTDDLIMQDLVQSIEEASRLAEDINSPNFSFGGLGGFSPATTGTVGRKYSGLAASFKRSSSTAEVTSSSKAALQMTNDGSDLAFRPSRRELKKSSSQEGNGKSDVPAAVLITLVEPRSNRNSMYASGTQSAYASRDPSPDSYNLPTLTLPRCLPSASLRASSHTITSMTSSTSPYPKAPPSMIITPRRAESVDRASGTGMTEAEVNVVYRKLEAIMATEDQEKSFNRRVAVVSGVDDHFMDKRDNIDTSCGDFSLVAPVDSGDSFVGHPSQSFSMFDERFSYASRTLPASRTKQLSSSTSVTAAAAVTSMTATSDSRGRGGSREAARPKTRSASLSPRTARKQFYENYDKVLNQQQLTVHGQPQYFHYDQLLQKQFAHAQQQHHQEQQRQKKYLFSEYVAEHKHPNDILGIEAGFTPISKTATTTASAGDVSVSTRVSTTQPSSSVGKKLLKFFSSKDSGDESRKSGATSVTDGSSSKSGVGFFQSVKERRKLFGGKKASSVDSPIGVSIARIGANVLSEPAAPSNYRPPDLPVINFPSSTLPTPMTLSPMTPTSPEQPPAAASTYSLSSSRHSSSDVSKGTVATTSTGTTISGVKKK